VYASVDSGISTHLRQKIITTAGSQAQKPDINQHKCRDVCCTTMVNEFGYTCIEGKRPKDFSLFEPLVVDSERQRGPMIAKSITQLLHYVAKAEHDKIYHRVVEIEPNFASLMLWQLQRNQMHSGKLGTLENRSFSSSSSSQPAAQERQHHLNTISKGSIAASKDVKSADNNTSDKWIAEAVKSEETGKRDTGRKDQNNLLPPSKRRKMTTTTMFSLVGGDANNEMIAHKNKEMLPAADARKNVLGSYMWAVKGVNAIIRMVDTVLSKPPVINNSNHNNNNNHKNNGVVVVEHDGHAVGRFGIINPAVHSSQQLSTSSPILNGIACAAVHAQNLLGRDATVCIVSLDEQKSDNSEPISSGTKDIASRLDGIQYYTANEHTEDKEDKEDTEDKEDKEHNEHNEQNEQNEQKENINNYMQRVNPSFLIVRCGAVSNVRASCLNDLVKWVDASPTCAGILVVMELMSFVESYSISTTMDGVMRTLRRD